MTLATFPIPTCRGCADMHIVGCSRGSARLMIVRSF